MDNVNRLLEILNAMDVPEFRKQNINDSWSWFIRNLPMRNRNHPDFDEAIKIIKEEYRKWIA